MVARRVGGVVLWIAMLCIAVGAGLSVSSGEAAVSAGAREEALDSTDGAQQQRPVLVLGSGGLIGRALVRWLKLHSFRVLEVKNREDIDLREPGAMDRFNASHVQFVYFLACEVGGSKFLESSSEAQQLAIIRHNLRIYETVLNWFGEEVARRRPASDAAGRPVMRGVFTSSYLQHMHNGYGAVKRVGEEWVRQLPEMKSVRLWNVYGYESIGLKSHVLNDWIWSCTARGVIPCTTDGLEYRQFTHADDVASALGAMMANFVVLDEVTDISSGEWVQLRDIGAVAQAAVAQLAEPSAPPCALTFNATRPAAIENSPAQRLRVDPTLDRPFHAAWRAAIGERISLEDGVSRLARVYAASVSAPETPSCAAEDDECAAAPRS